MRPYRGKETVSRKWVYGWYVKCDGGYYIVFTQSGITHKKQVDPSTVGQSTGKHDKNGKKVYAGDRFTFYHWQIESSYAVAYWHEQKLQWWARTKGGSCLPLYELSNIEIIGNIHSKERQ